MYSPLLAPGTNTSELQRLLSSATLLVLGLLKSIMSSIKLYIPLATSVPNKSVTGDFWGTSWHTHKLLNHQTQDSITCNFFWAHFPMQKKLTGKAGSLHRTMTGVFVSDVGMFGFFFASRSWLGKVASFGNLRWVISNENPCFDGFWFWLSLVFSTSRWDGVYFHNLY